MPSHLPRRIFLLAFGGLAAAGRRTARAEAQTAAVEKLLDEGKKRFLKRIQAVNESEWDLRIGQFRHTIGEEAEHVALSENDLQRLVEEALLEGPRPSLAAPLKGKEEMLREFFTNSSVENYRPQKKLINLPEVLEYYGKANRTLMELLADSNGLDEVVYEHPNNEIGHLTGLQWFYYIAYHRLLHIKRIEARMTHEDFPRRILPG